MQENLKIAGIQGPLAWENPKENRDYFEQKISALDDSIDLIILPEMFATGFSMNPQGIADTGTTLNWMKDQAITSRSALGGSLMVEEEGKFYNRFYFITPNGDVSYYDKRHRFTLAGEHKVYQQGKKPIIVTFEGWKICLQICYDLRFPVFSRNTSNYDLLIYVANWPKKRIFAWDTLLQARAIENMSYCVGINRIGIDGNDHEYTGHSGIYDSLGTTLAFAESKETTLFATLNRAHLTSTREQLNFLADRDQFLLQEPGADRG